MLCAGFENKLWHAQTTKMVAVYITFCNFYFHLVKYDKKASMSLLFIKLLIKLWLNNAMHLILSL